MSLNTKSSIMATDLNVEREDEVVTVQSNLNFVMSPADGWCLIIMVSNHFKHRTF